ncbi:MULTISPECIES: LrgB family protein [unclassified Polaribacter]|uniref:LrgB family protein n=1 Tax=unclassified Polaribacter TaxID=196858 RepID=UPI001C4FC9CF|nr:MULTISPECIES: LrgB family protein [unclassified Polaribacter]QXP62667.1 LrgB family protein [Polaribacter sp. HaHaR_3_91]QXP68416.1 LrgB family protein [Polaribacter sp. AHE13PA]QXP70592.1 LrgB family protein [Polaribacter sp. R2A056_3_33]
MKLISEPYMLLTITVGIYWLTKYLQNKTNSVLLNPILITIIAVIGILKLAGISYETYHEAGKFIEFFLKPSIVALGVPLYLQLSKIKKQVIPIFISQLVGSIVGIISGVLIAKWLGASNDVIISIAPKSVTTPLAIDISQSIGGIPSLTASMVVMVGIFGSVAGFKILQLFKVSNPMSKSLSMGTASHGLGTAQAMAISQRFGAYSSMGLILNGLFTAIFTPIILALLGII